MLSSPIDNAFYKTKNEFMAAHFQFDSEGFKAVEKMEEDSLQSKDIMQQRMAALSNPKLHLQQNYFIGQINYWPEGKDRHIVIRPAECIADLENIKDLVIKMGFDSLAAKLANKGRVD